MKKRPTARDYPRTARLNTLVREIIADQLERIDDERLELVTVTAVDCESDLRRAVVQFDSLRGAEDDEAVLGAFGELRPRLQKAVARQARLKRTPELRFEPDVVIRSAERVDEVLRGIEPPNDPT